MRNITIAALLTTVAARAFMSDTCETVSVNGGLRVNKSDYDADQADDGAKAYKLDGKAAQADHVQSAAGPQVIPAPGVSVPPAPAAPQFVDPTAPAPAQTPAEALAGVVPPTTVAPGSYLVKTEGTGAKAKVFVVFPNGDKVTDVAGIDEKGYADEPAAWAAIIAASPH